MSQRLYGIAEVAQKHGVTLRTLRFWEDKGLIAPERRGKTRLYDDRADARVERVALLRAAGMAIEDIQRLFRQEASGEDTRGLLAGYVRYLNAEVETRRCALVALGEELRA